jgi:excisionase family DNA binding protein
MVNNGFAQGPGQNGVPQSTTLTTREVARIFDVHPATIRRWCSQGKIKSYRSGAGGKLRFKREDVAIAYLERCIHKYIDVLSNRS